MNLLLYIYKNIFIRNNFINLFEYTSKLTRLKLILKKQYFIIVFYNFPVVIFKYLYKNYQSKNL